ncbi:MAG TPA: DUF2127 domain-containing protein [Candidatus Saccharimonadia bacterium]|nr:DUF2127 domain-containing protein [Candidatus Saccharimonadia bacterium]
MKRLIPQPVLDWLFRIAVAIKGFDGLIEMMGGLFLLIVPISKLHGWAGLAIYELADDHHAFIAQAITALDNHLTPGFALLAALYLLGHGAIKLGLAIALLRQHYHLYPWAIGFLLLFIAYQAYRVGYDHSLGLALLTGFDAIVAWLVYLEWRRHLQAISTAPSVATPSSHAL